MQVSAGSTIRVVGKLTMPKDDPDLDPAKAYETTFVELSIKYGDTPNFQMTRGYSLFVWAPTKSGPFQLSSTIPAEALNNNATVQVAYAVGEDYAFYQCIDVSVGGGQVFPAGEFPWGKGPDDTSFDVPECLGGDCGKPIDDGSLKDAHIVMIILGVLIALLFICLLFRFCTREPVENQEKPDKNQVPLEVEQPAAEPQKPEVPEPASPPKEDSENEPIGHVMYTPAEESDPTPQESSEQKSLDATGSQGRHFHFRYVEEDDDDGAKEEVV